MLTSLNNFSIFIPHFPQPPLLLFFLLFHLYFFVYFRVIYAF
nr:MAG TPA: hypothetical protein [Caudoviricetes sp.]